MSVLSTADGKSHTWKSQFKKQNKRKKKPENQKTPTNDPSEWDSSHEFAESDKTVFEITKSYLTGESSASDKK